MEGKFCSTCISWEKVAPKPSDAMGICTDPCVAMHVNLESKSNLSEENTMWTSGDFGCRYWKENDGTLLDFSDLIDEEGNPIDQDD